MSKARIQPKDTLYRITSEVDRFGLGKEKVAVVGDLGKSFQEEGLVLLDLEGKVLAVYNKNTLEVKTNKGLSVEEDKAAYSLGEAYARLYKFYHERGEEPNLTEARYLAATLAIPLRGIKEYARGKPFSTITAEDLAIKFKVHRILTKYRVETLMLENPDAYLDIEGRYKKRHERSRRS